MCSEMSERSDYYNLHSPRDEFYGYDNPMPLQRIVALSKTFGLHMRKEYMPGGLNKFEGMNPDRAVIFDVRSEDVIMVEI